MVVAPNVQYAEVVLAPLGVTLGAGIFKTCPSQKLGGAVKLSTVGLSFTMMATVPEVKVPQ